MSPPPQRSTGTRFASPSSAPRRARGHLLPQGEKVPRQRLAGTSQILSPPQIPPLHSASPLFAQGSVWTGSFTGRAGGPRQDGFSELVLTRSTPTLRPTGTTTGLRLVVRLKPVRKALRAPAGGELEEWGRRSRAGRSDSATFFCPERRCSPERPATLRLRAARKRIEANLGPLGRENNGARFMPTEIEKDRSARCAPPCAGTSAATGARSSRCCSRLHRARGKGLMTNEADKRPRLENDRGPPRRRPLGEGRITAP